MKKVFSGIIAALMVLSMSVTAFAAETITEQDGSKNIDVQAKSVYITPVDVYDNPVKDGKASVTTTNGAVISVTDNGANLDGLMLNVTEMVKEEIESYSWISGIMSGLCNKFKAYDIFFADKDGNSIDIKSEVTVSITTPNGYKNVQVYHIGSSQEPDEIASEQSGENTVFTANGFSYYVLAEKENGDGGTIDPTNPLNPDKQIDQNSPQTGDSSNIMLWFALLLVSSGALTIFGVTKKCKKANVK